jgi:CheY-like chemotaxis protein
MENIHKKILYYARLKRDTCSYKVPPLVDNTPLYDREYVIKELFKQLDSEGYIVCAYPDGRIEICWNERLVQQKVKTDAFVIDHEQRKIKNLTKKSKKCIVKNKSSKLVLYNSNFNLKNEILSVLESLRSLAEIKKIDLNHTIDSKLDTIVWADNVKIHQLFYNIIGNAIKFTDQGSITVTAGLSDQGTQYLLEVTIKDTGAGIPSEDLENIFDQHYQSKFHSEQIKLGAGLGLNLCKEIVDLFGGTITVNSVLQKGTEVRFSLLLNKSRDIKTSLEQLLEINRKKPLAIVIVDDDAITLVSLKKMISNTNAEVSTFTTATGLQNHLNNHTADLIITDLQLGTLSGIQLAREIRKTHSIPIIAVTGDDYWTQEKATDDSPFETVIIKPVNKEELYSKILKTVS